MVRNREKYEQVVSLRMRGFTLQEIAKYCVISKSTASKWLKDKPFSAEITTQNVKRAGIENAKRLTLVAKARRGERQSRYVEVGRAAETEFKHYKKDPFFMAGLALYLALGNRKDKSTIRFSTTRMDAHQIFIRFAFDYLGISKNNVHFWLLLPSDVKEETAMRKWQRAIRIPYSQFHKNQISNGTPTRKTLHNGTGNTIIGNTALKCKLDRWTELFVKKLSK